MRAGVAVLVVGVLGVGVFALAGCTATAPALPMTPPAPVVETTPVADFGDARPVLPPEGVVATGELRANSGSPLGQVQIIHDGRGGYEVALPDLPFTVQQRPFLALTDSTVAAAECASTTGYQYPLGNPEQWATGFQEPTGDPSYWRHLLVVQYGSVDACYLPILAAAALDWNVPLARPWISPVDSGPVAYAQGGVLVVGERPVAYRTRVGDAWSAIAARFGMSEDDLEYLNPQRSRAGTREAIAYQVLNLDPAGRGDSVTRLPGEELAVSEDFR